MFYIIFFKEIVEYALKWGYMGYLYIVNVVPAVDDQMEKRACGLARKRRNYVLKCTECTEPV